MDGIKVFTKPSSCGAVLRVLGAVVLFDVAAFKAPDKLAKFQPCIEAALRLSCVREAAKFVDEAFESIGCIHTVRIRC